MKQIGSRRVWSLGDVSRAIAARFEGIDQVWVEADVRGIRTGGSRTWFNLVDDAHSIDASMTSVVFDRLAPAPEEGGRVHALGMVEFASRQTRIGFRVARLEPAGEGLLLARIAALRARLHSEGVLTAQRGARPVPRLPVRIGLVTSRDGQARHDFLVNAVARFPDVDVLVAHAPVQGDAAAAAIAAAVTRVASAEGVQVVVVTRGGGSLEDLMAFNSEAVCRAVIACPVPVVSAIGHEGDRSLCDEVADLRVSTPTAAAVAVVPDRTSLDAGLARAEDAMAKAMDRARRDAGASLDAAGARLGRALGALGRDAHRRLAEVDARARRALDARVAAAPPRVEAAERELARTIRGHLERAEGRVTRSDELLHLLGPERTVQRGYAIVRREDGAVVADRAAAPAGTRLRIALRDGELPAVAGAGGSKEGR